MNNSSITMQKLLFSDLPELQKLSQEIWYDHYSTILSSEQIEYMLNLMYSAQVITNEINNLGILYHKVIKDKQMVGYLSYGLEKKDEIDSLELHIKLHKCYLLPTLHGYGYGQILLSHIRQQAKQMNVNKIILNVNKRNGKAIKAYTRFGFKIIASEINDIGHGFVMDDYIMAYELDLKSPTS